MIQATPIKLRDGSWGVRVPHAAIVEGTPVQVRTRAGKTWTATISRVLWRSMQDGVAICATRKGERSGSSTRRRGPRFCECGWAEDMLSTGYRPGERTRCPECGGIAEAC